MPLQLLYLQCKSKKQLTLLICHQKITSQAGLQHGQASFSCLKMIFQPDSTGLASQPDHTPPKPDNRFIIHNFFIPGWPEVTPVTPAVPPRALS